MQIMSNGEYQNVEHRAVVNPEKQCLSIATFQCPDKSKMIGPLPELVKENGANYKTISNEEYDKTFFNQ